MRITPRLWLLLLSVPGAIPSACGCSSTQQARPAAAPTKSNASPGSTPGASEIVADAVRSDVHGFASTLSVPTDANSSAQTRLFLNGSGLCEYGIFGIDVYYAALYLEKPTSDVETAIREGGLACIEKRWCRNLSKNQLTSAWNGAFSANFGDDLPRYKAALDRLNALMEPVEEGELTRFIVRPGSVEVTMRGKSVGFIEDTALAAAFVRLYLGEHPPDRRLRSAMLAGARYQTDRK